MVRSQPHPQCALGGDRRGWGPGIGLDGQDGPGTPQEDTAQDGSGSIQPIH